MTVSDTTHVSDTADPAALAYFATELGDLWPDVAPLCVDPGSAGDADLRATRRAAAPQSSPASALADLDALVAGWPHYSESQRAVLQGAVAYVAGDGRPGRSPSEGEDVVGAAVRAVLRGGRH